jgi:hypothetical protein
VHYNLFRIYYVVAIAPVALCAALRATVAFQYRSPRASTKSSTPNISGTRLHINQGIWRAVNHTWGQQILLVATDALAAHALCFPGFTAAGMCLYGSQELVNHIMVSSLATSAKGTALLCSTNILHLEHEIF